MTRSRRSKPCSGQRKEYPGANDRQALSRRARAACQSGGRRARFHARRERKFLAVLPGVPAEMQAMFRESLRPALEEHFGGKAVIPQEGAAHLRSVGVKVNELIQDVLKQKRPAVGLSRARPA